ncbi:MAG TPA: MFS transporter [Candidatus Acidoferrales bacterium]|nr:MFS transporter [Candidatus Acidoferrales bacterium]
MSSPPTSEHLSGWAPLRRPLFRTIWLASLISNLGSWMQDTAGTWLMTALTTSQLLIALMQTAASLPVLLLGLPAGATADIFERRRLLIFWQAWMLATVAILSVLTFTGVISPWTLLVLTFLLNIGSAMNNPGWQAIIPELVPRTELPDAISTNSAGFNLARAVGPALGGLTVAAFVVAAHGAGLVFLLNSASFIAVIIALYRWKRSPPYKSALPSERMLGSMRAGIRYIRYVPALQNVLLRALIFTFFSSAVWALLAVVAEQDLHRGAMAYGILTGCLGLGAVVGASLLPKIRRLISADQIGAISSGVFSITLLVLALVRNVPVIVIWLLAAGFAWTSMTSTMNVAVQLTVPAWVQARALGVYQMIFMGGMAAGSTLWGFIAEHATTSRSLLAAGIAMLVSIPIAGRFHILRGQPPDVSPYQLNRPAPQVVIEPHPEAGPVMVTIEYLVHEPDYVAFTHAIHQLRDVRLRDGAIRWGIFQDAAQPDRFVETFVVESWLEFLRERERMTTHDRAIRDRARQYHYGESEPKISFMIYAREDATS